MWPFRINLPDKHRWKHCFVEILAAAKTSKELPMTVKTTCIYFGKLAGNEIVPLLVKPETPRQKRSFLELWQLLADMRRNKEPCHSEQPRCFRSSGPGSVPVTEITFWSFSLKKQRCHSFHSTTPTGDIKSSPYTLKKTGNAGTTQAQCTDDAGGATRAAGEDVTPAVPEPQYCREPVSPANDSRAVQEARLQRPCRLPRGPRWRHGRPRGSTPGPGPDRRPAPSPRVFPGARAPPPLCSAALSRPYLQDVLQHVGLHRAARRLCPPSEPGHAPPPAAATPRADRHGGAAGRPAAARSLPPSPPAVSAEQEMERSTLRGAGAYHTSAGGRGRPGALRLIPGTSMGARVRREGSEKKSAPNQPLSSGFLTNLNVLRRSGAARVPPIGSATLTTSTMGPQKS